MVENTSLKIALISNYSLEYTTGNYFRDVFSEMRINFDMFLPRERHTIPYGYNIHFYVDDGTHYAIPRRAGVMTILYLIDTHMDLKSDLIMAKMADLVLCAQQNAVIPLRRLLPNVYWVPLACSEHTHYRDVKNKLYDVAFVGGVADNRRAKILSALQKAFPRSFLGRAEREQIGTIYSSSKIVINVAINNDINMRFFEGLCSGAFLVTDRISDNGMDNLLQGYELPICDFFSDVDELIRKIHYYLEHDDEREQIAKRGRKFAKDNTYRDRWDYIYTLSKDIGTLDRSFGEYVKTCMLLKMSNGKALFKRYACCKMPSVR